MPAPHECRRVYFLETPFDLLSEREVLKLLSSGKHTENKFKYIVTPNVDHIVRNNERHDLSPYYHEAWLSVCDSRIAARLARSKGYPIRDIITGSDLTFKIFDAIIKPEHHVTIIGCDEDSVNKIRAQYRLKHIHHHNPKMGFIHDADAIESCCKFVAEHPSDFVMLAVGSPQQEILAHHLQASPETRGIGLCIGASLLFLAGKETRAPRIFATLGLEWLFRLLQNPKRLWRRYFHDLKIFQMTLKSSSHDGNFDVRNLE